MADNTISNMELYIQEFNIINNSKYKLKDLFCADCDELCNCRCINPVFAARLSDSLFPCLKDACNFKGILSEFQKHSKLCMFGSASCPIDNKQFNNVAALINHLSVHKEVTNVKLESLSVAIDLSVKDKKDQIILADYHDNYFIIFIRFRSNSVLIEVGKHLVREYASIRKFTLVRRNTNFQFRCERDIIPLVALLNGVENGNCLRLFNVDGKVTLHFDNCENLKIQFKNCPICFDQLLLSEIKQCRNAHAFCKSCASKKRLCPTCNKKLNLDINLNNILEGHSACSNLALGCLEVVDLSATADHNKRCAFRKLNCSDCKEDFLAHQIVSHVNEKHSAFKNFNSICIKLIHKKIHSVYIIYRSKVFCLKLSLGKTTVYFFAELLNTDGDRAANYCYRVNLMKGNDVIATSGNVCESMDLNNTFRSSEIQNKWTSTINLEPYEQCFFTNNSWEVKCQFIVLYNEKQRNLELEEPLLKKKKLEQ